jgi:hypothetical protein
MVKDREVNPLVNQNKNKSAGGSTSTRVLKPSGNYQSSLQPSLFHQEEGINASPVQNSNHSSNFNFISGNYGDKIQRAEQIMNGLAAPLNEHS